jgi:xylan 1,4-beta-xylosidase
VPKYQGAVEVKTPVIPGFYPDPSIVRVGDTYYIANSSFEYGPNVPIHSSTDLVNFSLAGHGLPTAREADLRGQGDSLGTFAPTLRYHNGKFYMITTLVDDKWQVLVSAEDVAGPWSEPIRIPLQGIDPDLAWDDEGNCIVTFASLEVRGIGQSLINHETGEILTETKRVWQGTGGKFPEGPHLYRIGDWWYLLIAEGGTERGHAVTVARSKNYDGPFESPPVSPLLSNRGTDLPVQNTGHADLVQRPDGSWAMVFHGTRPRGASPEWHVLGRETFAVEIDWVDGWPVVSGTIEGKPQLPSEILNQDSNLPADWIAPANWPSELVSKTPQGLRFNGFVARRQLAKKFDLLAELAVPAGSPAGLEVRIDSRHWIRIGFQGDEVQVNWGIGDHQFLVGSAAAEPNQQLRVQAIELEGGFHAPVGPDQLIFSVVSAAGAETELARIDGRYISTEVAGGMTGRVLGVYAQSEAYLRKWHLNWN